MDKSDSKTLYFIRPYHLIALFVLAVLAVVIFHLSGNEGFPFYIKMPVLKGLLLIVGAGFLISFVLWQQWRMFNKQRLEARAAEIELEKSNSLLKATLDSTADGLLVVNLNGKVVLYNNNFAKMWKVPEEELSKGDDTALLGYVKNQLTNPEAFVKIVEDYYRETGGITFDILNFADGRCFERYSRPQIINGLNVGRVWSFRDITEKSIAEKELISAKEKAEEGNRLKTSFLHNVSHEIRTPMNAIMGFSTLLNEKNITEQERQQYASIISQSSTQLLSIINDIVDIANIESGQAKPHPEPVNVNQLLRMLVEQFGYSNNNIKILIHAPLKDDQAVLQTDPVKFNQVITNLLSNAIKFTKEGEIDIGYEPGEGIFEFFVRDTGIGIPAEHIGKIFERFYQVDASGARKYGGTGLGLSICHAYVNLLGGRIWVESTAGKGSVFRFTLPS